MLKAKTRACHSRVAISIDEIDLAIEKNVTVIRTAGEQDESDECE
jgi:hypothetical protein